MKVLNQKVARRPKCFSSSSSSDWLVQNCVTLTMVFAQNSSILQQAVQDCWIRNTVVSMESSWHPLLTQCLNRAWPILHTHLLGKHMRTDLLLWDRWQSSAQACICC